MKWLYKFTILTILLMYFTIQGMIIKHFLDSNLGYVPWLFILGFYWGWTVFDKDKI